MLAAAASVRSRLQFTRQCSSTAEKLVDIVATGVGSLQEMEAQLDHLDITLNPSLITHVIDSSSKRTASSRRLLRFFSWCRQRSELGDELFNRIIRSLSEMKDTTAMGIVISDLQKEGRKIEPQTFVRASDAFVKSGRPEEAVRLFRDIEEKNLLQWRKCKDEGWSSVSAVVHALCSKGHARKAQGVLFHHKDKVKAKLEVHYHRSLVLHGWSVHGNAREARRVIEEMKSSGDAPSLASYHDLLRCLCRRNLKFNPSALVPEAANLMTEMRSSGVAPTAVSFNILLSCLGKARRVKEACRILLSMTRGEEGAEAQPDIMSYYLVIRLLYLTERFDRGNKIMNKMIEFEEEQGKLVPRASARFYHGLIGLLCGMEKMEHALQLFERMKKSFCCCEGNGKEKFDGNNSCGLTYDLLITKLCRNGKFDLGRRLWNEAVGMGIALKCSNDLLDPLKALPVFDPTVKPPKVDVDSRKCMTGVLLNKKKNGAALVSSRKGKIKAKQGY